MTRRELEEYRALRATIRQRGTARPWVLVAGLVGWGGLATATSALAALPVATLLPLLVLAAVFEALLALHLAVERIGRYIQVFFEVEQGDQDAGRKWEHATMAYDETFSGRRGTGDPLFALVFLAATVLNFVPVLIAEPVAIELYVVGGAHLAFLGRIVVARQRAARQRAADLQRFQQLKAFTSAPKQ